MKTIILKSKLKNYPILIERGLSSQAGSLIKKYFINSEKVILITSDKILSIYKEKINEILKFTKKDSKVIILKDGESQKNLENTEYIYKNLIEFNTHRNDLIIAFGGGVIGDISGFAASTFHRGMKLTHIPTTITAQVDSSIGGKVVVNYKDIKNIIGSFYQPDLIIIDPDFLLTLEEKEIINGLAEILKYGIVFDKKILKSLKNLTFKKIQSKDLNIYKRLNLYTNITERKNENKACNESSSYLFSLVKEKEFENLIYKCAKIKSAVVIKDEFDTGYRNLLNFGHTIGHAIEKVEKLKYISHGEAVALGMIVAIDISIELRLSKAALKDKIIELYKLLKLPFLIPKIDVEEILLSLKYDKKFSSTKNKFILIKGINKPIIKSNIDLEIIKKSILKNM